MATRQKTLSNRDFIRWAGLLIGAAFIVGGVFKPVAFQVAGKSTDNALIFSGLLIIVLVMVGVQLAKYLSMKAGGKE
jgi:hypothetical protein